MTDAKEKNTVKEPFMRIAKRNELSGPKAWGVRGIALVLALLFCGLFVNIVGGIPLIDVFAAMWQGTFGKFGNATSIKIRCWDTAIYAAKLLCIAVALAPVFKMRFWNIGAEGQVLMGGLAAAFFMYEFGGKMPAPLLLVLMILTSILAGAVWGVIPAFFKANFGTNETLFTLMMNYVAIKAVDYYYNFKRGDSSTLAPSEYGHLPDILGHGYTLNIIVFLLLAVAMYFYLKKTKHGYEIAVVGESKNTARYAGINVKKVIIRTMIISGAVCGICGGLTVAGQEHSISSGTTAGGYGFTAIIVAWLAKFNTLGMILISLLIIFLEKGAGQLTNQYNDFPAGAGSVLVGIVLFFIIGSEFFINYKVVFCEKVRRIFKRKAKEGEAV